MGESTYDEGVVVFDIDGTLADCEHRRHHVAGDKKNFDRFFDEMGEDAPKEVIVRLCNGLTTLGWQVHIMTGRPEKYRRVTESWLLHHHIRYETLHMRPDSRLYDKDSDVKSDMADGLDRPIRFVVDDRQQVVDMWRERGITCLQCDAGNF